MTHDELIAKVFAELKRAERLYPGFPTDPLHAFAIVQEEVGETQKAVLQAVYEPHKASPADVEKEAIQAATMALRFVLNLDQYIYEPREGA